MKRLSISFVFAVLTTAATANARMHTHQQQCIETADVVGETRCRNFGGWWATERSVPLFVDFGGWTSFLRAPLVGDVAAGTKTTIDGTKLSGGALRAHGFEIRMGGLFSRYAYVGFGLGVALGSHNGQPLEVNGSTVTLADGINVYHGRMATFVGVRAPLGRVSLRLEIAPALQLMGYRHKVITATGTELGGGGNHLGIALDARAMVDVWITPDTTLSLWTGANTLRPGDFTAGLMIGGHLRAFDGADK